jgi:hypothetical protein
VIVAHAGDMFPADAAAANPAHVASAKATTHVASSKAATHVASTSTSTASLCTRGKKAPGKHRARENHHHSSSHDILHLIGRTYRHRTVLRRCSSAG